MYKASLCALSTCFIISAMFYINCRKKDDDANTADVNDFVYLVQSIDLEALGETAFDLAIIDYSLDGSDALRFTTQQINDLKNSPGGYKIVIAYMSIGEAENYRWYWQSEWDADNDGVPDSVAPSWLDIANPDWPGNYKVQYWDTCWQAIILGSDSSYLDKIVESGFDGVYLDIVDAYEYWGPGGPSGLERSTAEQEMVDFVRAIAEYARFTKEKPFFMVFPQNGEGLSSHTDYVNFVSGIGKEDTWFNDNTPQPEEYIREVTNNLDVFLDAGKLVFVIDYVTQSDLVDNFYSLAEDREYIPYATVRDLDQITINPGHEPD